MAGRLLRFSDYAPKEGQYLLLVCDLPGRGEKTIGVMLLDPAENRLYVRLRRDWQAIGEEEDVEVLAELGDDLQAQADEIGAAAVLDRLEQDASLALRVSEREAVTIRGSDRTLGELYRAHVPAEVQQFRTHLPRFALAVAAGPFLTNPDDVTAEEWVEIPDGLKLDPDMFVARIQGHSMEPRIPDGSLCVFRRNVVGSRQGRLVLVRNSELADDNQYTVKRYQSFKQQVDEGFVQNRIRLESLNPAYPSWDLDPEEEKYEVIAEFVTVLE